MNHMNYLIYPLKYMSMPNTQEAPVLRGRFIRKTSFCFHQIFCFELSSYGYVQDASALRTFGY